MKYKLLFSILLCLAPLFLAAQDVYSIKGIAVDALISVQLPNTSISILNSTDSTLYKFTWADSGGKFSMTKLRAGNFILLVTYPGYADYVEHFTLDSANRQKNLEPLSMFLKANLLQDVIIKGEAIAVRLKGDTTEYNAGAYSIEPNSKVEDLLKQLPGIQVDQNGKITAQGMTVQKVLVDGEEFFGDDPTLVTKNLRADMVDKVQLFDKKSDQATFTGIDDGQKTKTLNIKLKEDKKRGYFGKADVGMANRGFFQGQAMANVFKAQQKLSAYGTIGNTGRTGLHFRDNIYGGTDPLTDDGSDEFISFNGRYNNQGIPDVLTGGIHYDAKWNQARESINTDLMIGSIGIEGIRNIVNQNNLPGGSMLNFSGQEFINNASRQKLTATYQLKIDSTSNFKVSIDGSLKNNDSENVFKASSFGYNNNLLNTGNRTLNNHVNQNIFSANTFWNKRFKKKGRTISLHINNSYNENYSTAFLTSVNTFFNPAGTDSVQKIDQMKRNNVSGTNLTSNISFTEALTALTSVVLSHDFAINSYSSERNSFNKSWQGEYDIFDPDFSNDFLLKQFYNQLGALFNYKKEKTTVTIGSKAAAVNFNQTDQNTGIAHNRKFINLTPKASFKYQISKQRNLSFSYDGRTIQPKIDQIQPVVINDDPLNIHLGNQDLSPSFDSRFNMNYNANKTLNGQNIYINATYGFMSNAIVDNITTNPLSGKNILQTFNLSGKAPANFAIYGSLSQKVNKAGLSLGFNLNAYGNKYYNYINEKLNATQSYTFSGSVTARQYVAKKYSFNLSVSPSYNRNQSSLQKQMNNNGWGLNCYGASSIILPGKLEIGSTVDYVFKGKTQSFNEDFDRLLWNSTLSKRFLKAENLQISVSANDLLNQNIGFSRSASSNFISQNSYTTIKRYFMLSLIYDFNKMGTEVQTK